MNSLPIYILAGGQSSRFGSDKARAVLSGVAMIRRVSEALGPVAQSVTAVASDVGAYEDLGIATIADLRPGLGPLGGLETALSDRAARHGEGWLLLASCDLADPNAQWARLLIGRISPDAKAVAFKGDRWEPLFALYHSSLLADVRQQLDLGRGALWSLIESAHGTAVALPDGVRHIRQMNTRLDFKNLGGTGG